MKNDLIKPTIVLDIGTTCNVNCVFCYKEYQKNKNNYFKGIVDIKEEIKNISKISNKILLTGGEPLLYPYLIELLNECKKYNISVCIVTLGDKLSNMNFLKDILKIGVIKSIQVSIHTIDEGEGFLIYGKKGIIKKQLNGIKNLLELNIKVGINIVMNIYNINSIGETILKLNDIGIEIFYISAIHIFEGITKNNIISTTLYLKIRKQLAIISHRLNNGKIKLALKSFPLCIHNHLKKFKYEIRELNIKDSIKSNNTGKTSWEIKNKFKIKLNKCLKCYAYGKKCFGPYGYYVKIFGDNEFISLSENEYFILKNNNMGNVWDS